MQEMLRECGREQVCAEEKTKGEKSGAEPVLDSQSRTECVSLKKKNAKVRALTVDGRRERRMRAEMRRDHIREKISTRKRRGRRCRAFPFLYGTVFRDGSASVCAELRKPSPCNNSFTKKLWR
jgi:hypothetical protein